MHADAVSLMKMQDRKMEDQRPLLTVHQETEVTLIIILH